MTIIRLFASDVLRERKCVCQFMKTVSRKVSIQTMKSIIHCVTQKCSEHYW